jgi:hypothetical protein
MKKLLAIFALVIAFSFAANAQYNGGGTKHAEATIGCHVITPLTIDNGTAMFDKTGEVIVAGTPRTFAAAVNMNFSISGEGTRAIDITKSVSWDKPGCTIIGDGWGTTPTPTALVGGMASLNYNVTGVTAAGTAHGEYTLTVAITVVYHSI